MNCDVAGRTPAEAMLAVLNALPDLTDFGFGVYEPRRMTVKQIADRMIDDRAKMLDERSLNQFQKCREWLRPRRRKTINSAGTSYGLKHIAQNDIGYSTNGVFIAAAVAEGFAFQRITGGSPNAFLSVSSKSWNHKLSR